MKLDYLDLILENCEVIHIDGKYICFFKADDIQTSFYGIGSWTIKQETVRSFCVELHPKANTIHYPLGVKDRETTTFARLKKYPDITHIEFVLDGQKYYYAVDWDGIDGQDNIYQTTYESELGFLYIKVEKDKSILDFFTEDYIKNANEINHIYEGENENVQEAEEDYS